MRKTGHVNILNIGIKWLEKSVNYMFVNNLTKLFSDKKLKFSSAMQDRNLFAPIQIRKIGILSCMTIALFFVFFSVFMMPHKPRNL